MNGPVLLRFGPVALPGRRVAAAPQGDGITLRYEPVFLMVRRPSGRLEP